MRKHDRSGSCIRRAKITIYCQTTKFSSTMFQKPSQNRFVLHPSRPCADPSTHRASAKNRVAGEKKSAKCLQIQNFGYLCNRIRKRRQAKRQKGAVVQLVRIHACHAWGRGFESRPHRLRKGKHPLPTKKIKAHISVSNAICRGCGRFMTIRNCTCRIRTTHWKGSLQT